jgi:hypothetical protein
MSAIQNNIHSVTMRTWFYLNDAPKPVLCEYTMTRQEWNKYRLSHKLARWIPFTCAADWMDEDLEDLVCGHKIERYTIIAED